MNFRSPIERHVRAFNWLTECETVTQHKNKWKERDRPREAFRRKDRIHINFIIFLFLKIRRKKATHTHTHTICLTHSATAKFVRRFTDQFGDVLLFVANKSNNIIPLNKSAFLNLNLWSFWFFFFSLTQFIRINYVQHCCFCCLYIIQIGFTII